MKKFTAVGVLAVLLGSFQAMPGWGAGPLGNSPSRADTRSAVGGGAFVAAKKWRTLSFQNFLRLTKAEQTEYLTALRKTLVEMEHRSPSRHHAVNGFQNSFDRTAHALEKAIDQVLFCSEAVAGLSDNYCLNQGIVIKVGDTEGGQQCTQTPNDDMHNFDTRQVLKNMGLSDDNLRCSDPSALPASIFFGIQADGTLYCSKSNWTPTCDQLTPHSDTSLRDALVKCGQQGQGSSLSFSSGTTMSCDKLVNIYLNQSQTILDNCTETYKNCRYVKERVTQLNAQLASDPSTLEALKAFSQVQDQVSNPGPNDPNCDSTPGKGGAPDSSASAVECPNIQDMTQVATSGSAPRVPMASDFLKSLHDNLNENLNSVDTKQPPQCVNYLLPGDRRLNLDLAHPSTGLWLEVKNNGVATQIPLKPLDLNAVSKILSYFAKDPTTTPLQGLLDQVLPAASPSEVPYQFKPLHFQLPAHCQSPTSGQSPTGGQSSTDDDQKQKALCEKIKNYLVMLEDVNAHLNQKDQNSRTWTSVNGEVLRYSTDSVATLSSSPNLGIIEVDAKAPHQAQESPLLAFPLPLDLIQAMSAASGGDASSAPAPAPALTQEQKVSILKCLNAHGVQLPLPQGTEPTEDQKKVLQACAQQAGGTTTGQ